MFPTGYFPATYFAPTYWPKSGSGPAPPLVAMFPRTYFAPTYSRPSYFSGALPVEGSGPSYFNCQIDSTGGDFADVEWADN